MSLIDQPFIFIIGAPRSGTTWLQTLLGAHPAIVTGQESHLFSHYLLPLWKAWQQGLEWMKEDERYTGLTSYLTQDEFDGLMQTFIYTVFSKLQGAKPTAHFILEKTPIHTLHLDFISYYLPTARYIHIIRDGRDVAVSLLSASKTWGREWAARNVWDAARTWKQYVLAGREGRAFGDRYTEVRYEDLHTNGVAELERLFRFLGIECPTNEIARIYEEQRFENLVKSNRESTAFVRSGEVVRQLGTSLKEPDGFYRKGVVGDWRTNLSRVELQIFYQEAGDLLVELGYETRKNVYSGMFTFRVIHRIYQVVRPFLNLAHLEVPLRRFVQKVGG